MPKTNTKESANAWNYSITSGTRNAFWMMHDEDQARDMINKNILRFEHKIIDEEVKDWDIEDVEEVEE